MTANIIGQLSTALGTVRALLAPSTSDGSDTDSEAEQPVETDPHRARETVWQPADEDLTLLHGDITEGVWTIEVTGDDLRGVPQRARSAVAEHEPVVYADLGVNVLDDTDQTLVTVEVGGDDDE